MAPMNGTIKRLVSEKGFGFVAAGDGNEYFFHQSACNGCQFDSLREGQAVTVEQGQSPHGPPPAERSPRLSFPSSTGQRLTPLPFFFVLQPLDEHREQRHPDNPERDE